MKVTDLTIAIVVGEKSGDLLGADLIRNLKKIYPSNTSLNHTLRSTDVLGYLGCNII